MTEAATSHPCPFSRELMPVLVEEVAQFARPPILGSPALTILLDPMAGTGRASEIADAVGMVYLGYEIEPEFAAMHPLTVCGDSRMMTRVESGSVTCIVTSAAYGGRMADQYLGTPAEQEERAKTGKIPRRRSYAISLNRRTHPDSGGGMQWGPKYRALHTAIMVDCWRVLEPGGGLVLNISNHYRKGVEVQVAAWWYSMLEEIGFEQMRVRPVQTRRFKDGDVKARDLRPAVEYVATFRKPT